MGFIHLEIENKILPDHNLDKKFVFLIMKVGKPSLRLLIF
ncbi:hypothetical protein LEP1GSC064_2753 [Leptospira kirschneri serovar Grippotyphosa str. Moskva]|nr:hypothetical protein LEP1GSC064_2753 [Leptospira kirschneri serovar Grippotyphosa str. Moskva]EKR08654.1 hypothetical protein LEP1GSC122_1583 [Leptospira kirschneri serovar Valbuzzi str. 200702274]EMK17434.1 hypothetical protein LEP1GSC042_3432 [Leptospira kirschneri serovar Bim str. PUO 1247]EMN06156.1 hypothetical protein LEP1GSC046_2673 [Leptospira kirschneri serovar Bim str. 1051]EMN26534.1 hypothetical protein LEP1GSC065_0768 [Leptospira kirschneri serovar Sokoine str. RM1]